MVKCFISIGFSGALNPSTCPLMLHHGCCYCLNSLQSPPKRRLSSSIPVLTQTNEATIGEQLINFSLCVFLPLLTHKVNRPRSREGGGGGEGGREKLDDRKSDDFKYPAVPDDDAIFELLISLAPSTAYLMAQHKYPGHTERGRERKEKRQILRNPMPYLLLLCSAQ